MSQQSDGDRFDDLYGRPTAIELLVAAREFLEDEVMPATHGRVQFHTRVTLRVLDTVIRELDLGPDHRARHRELLASLGCESSWDLVGDIRAGRHDGRIEDLAEQLVPVARWQLEVEDPRHLNLA